MMEGFVLKSLHPVVADKLDKKTVHIAKKIYKPSLVYSIRLIHADFDKGNSSARLFFADFSKGFDLVDHHVIISELGNLGVQPVEFR